MAKTPPTKNRTQTKRPATNQAGPGHAQDSVNRLYVAHQVHTLANILFHKIARSGPELSRAPVVQQTHQPANAFGLGGSPWGTTSWPSAAGTQPVVPQPILYWYP